MAKSLTKLAQELGLMDDPFTSVKQEEEVLTEKKVPTTPPSATALQLDDWTRRKGLELTENEEVMRDKEIDENEAADFYGAAFLPDPKMAEHCTDNNRFNYMQTLMETPDYQDLHRQTAVNVEAAELAACSFAVEWAAYRKDCADAKKASSKAPSPMAAASKALSSAAGAVSSYGDTLSAMGMGGDGTGSGGKLNKQRIGNVMKRVAKSQNLKKIIELAGKFRRVAQSQQRQKAKHGLDEAVGVVQRDDLPRMLPQEVALMTDPELELYFLKKYSEKQTLCFDFSGIESVAKGPIIVTVDESGSMTGEKIETAKAFALAVAWIARKQKRWCAFMAFSGGREHRTIIMEPGKPNEMELIEWLEGFMGGGTTLDVPLVELPAMFDEKMSHLRGKTDVICITDAEVNCPPEIAESFLEWKKRSKCKMITIVIEGEAGDLAQVSDQLFLVPSISTEEEAVTTALSI